MRTRYLQPDDRSVIWHDAARTAALPGRVTDMTAGAVLPKAARYRLRASHVCTVTGVKKLPVELQGRALFFPSVFDTTFFREMPVKYGVTTLLHEFSSFFVASAMGMCYNK